MSMESCLLLLVICVYFLESEKYGDCTVWQLCEAAQIFKTAASKAMCYDKEGVLIPTVLNRGHGKVVLGSLKRFSTQHSEYLYSLYSNPALQVYGYCKEFELGFKLSDQLVLHWFNTVSKKKGVQRILDTRPNRRETYENC